MLHYLGLILVLLSWSVIGYILIKWRGTKAMSISQHAATSKHALVLLGALLACVGFLFYYWLLMWFVPKLQLGDWFVGLLTLAFVGQFIAGIVPEVPGIKRRIHRAAAYGMAYLFIPLSWLIVDSQHISSFAYYVGLVCLTYLIGSMVIFYTSKRSKKHYLVLQVIYIVAFQLQILVAAYNG